MPIMSCSPTSKAVASENILSTRAGGSAGITATVMAKQKNNLTRPGIALAPNPIMAITMAEIRASGSKKSAILWLITDSVNSMVNSPH